jgi:hypothetical protein
MKVKWKFRTAAMLLFYISQRNCVTKVTFFFEDQLHLRHMASESIMVTIVSPVSHFMFIAYRRKLNSTRLEWPPPA